MSAFVTLLLLHANSNNPVAGKQASHPNHKLRIRQSSVKGEATAPTKKPRRTELTDQLIVDPSRYLIL
ncbi:hypothetical protein D3C72_785400 [compost metagenome]